MSPLEPITSLQDPIEEVEEDPYRWRLRLLQAVVLLGCLALIAQLARLQVIEGDLYRERADNNRLRVVTVDSPRGVIYDRNHAILARNRPTYTVGVVVADLPTEPEPVYRRLASAVGLSAADIRRLVDKSGVDRFALIPIRTNLPEETAFVLEERHRELPGVHVVVQPIREYPAGPATAHVLGYLGSLSAQQYERLKSDQVRRYGVSDRIGQTNVEAAYEQELRGGPGQRWTEVDAGGREVRVLSVDQPKPGHNLVLTIDLELQQRIYDLLAARLDRYEVASAVALEPATGQVLALVHLPSYDDNLFSRGISDEDLQRLMSDPRNPLVNGAIGSAYPPGTLFEAITAAAALQEGVVKPDGRVSCQGPLIVPSRLNASVGTRFADSTDHGEQDVVSALADACNVYFYLAGGGDPDGKTNGLGPEGLMSYARAFGLGELSGVELDGETSGFLGSPAWMKQALGQDWYKGDTYQAATGEAYILATPLQMANAAAAVANGGALYRPQILRDIEEADGQGNTRLVSRAAAVIRRLPVSPENLALVREGLRATTGSGKTRFGTAYSGPLRNLDTPGIDLAGAASSVPYAWPDPRGEPVTHGWFFGFAPTEEPRIALAVFLRRGKGPEEAAQIAKEILASYLGRGVAPRS